MCSNISGEPVDRSSNSYYIESQCFSAKALEPALYIVSTPIGNLADITLRALQTLAAVDIIACEDTRVSRILLRAFGITKPLKAYHEHNAKISGAELLRLLELGKSVALISDAGTPLVSDPGSWLVKQVLEANIKVVPIPGPSSILAALVASGLETKEFLFVGFLPSKQQARIRKLEEFKAALHPVVLFEAPHRLVSSLEAMSAVLGAKRQVCICRELTKMYETISTDSIENLLKFYKQQERIRGEIVIIIDSSVDSSVSSDPEKETNYFLQQLEQDLPLAQIAAKIAQEVGQPRAQIYKKLLELNKLR